MDFTDAERKAWHDERRRRGSSATLQQDGVPTATCLHCQREFPISEGVVTADAALCDICNGD